MGYQLFKRHEDLFLHCQFDSPSDITPELIRRIGADFYTFDEWSMKAFVHITHIDNVEKIKEEGLIYLRNSTNHLGDGNYCLSAEYQLETYDLINFYRYIGGCLNEDYVFVFGYYMGETRYCFLGEAEHTGYTVLLNDVPKENITKIMSLKDIKINKDLEKLIREQLKKDYDIVEDIVFNMI